MCTLTESPKSKACRLDKRNQRLSLLPGGVQKSRAWRVLLASKVNGALPRQHATAAAIQQNHCLLPAMGALEDRALLLLGRTFKPDQYLPPVRQISGSHEKSNRPGHQAPRCSHSKLRRALAGSARVSVEGAGTGEHHMPALPSKGKSRDLSFAALIPVSAGGIVKRLGSPDEEQHALLLFLSDSGNGGRAGSLG